MKTCQIQPYFKILLIAICFFIIVPYVRAEQPYARVFSLEGEVKLIKKNQTQEHQIEVGTMLFLGDQLNLSENSRAAIKLEEGGFIRLGSLAQIKFQETSSLEKKSLLK